MDNHRISWNPWISWNSWISWNFMIFMKSMKIMKFARKPWKFHDFRTPGPPKMTHFWTPFFTILTHFELLLPQPFIRNPIIWATPKKCLKTWHFWTPLKKWDVIKMGFLADDRFLSPFFTVLTNLTFWPFWIFKRHFFTVLAILAILAFLAILAKTVFQNDPTFCRMILQQTKGAPLPLKLTFWRGVQKWGHFGTPFLTPFSRFWTIATTGPYKKSHNLSYPKKGGQKWVIFGYPHFDPLRQKWPQNRWFWGYRRIPKMGHFWPPFWPLFDPFWPIYPNMPTFAHQIIPVNTGLIQGGSKRVPKVTFLGYPKF